MKMSENYQTLGKEHRPWHVQPDGSPAAMVGWLLVVVAMLLYFVIFGPEVFSQAQIPGTDASDKMEAAGTVLRLLDTALFKWGARLFAGVCIMSAAWSLKEQRFGIAVICVIGAMLFGTAPTWVKNIFSITGSDSVFGEVIDFPAATPADLTNVREAAQYA